MIVRSFTFNPFSTNCYVITDGDETVVIDPSCESDGEKAHVRQAIDTSGAPLTRVLLTHAHIDHIFGCAALCRAYDVGLSVHRDDEPLLARAQDQATMFGMQMEAPPAPTQYLEEGSPLTVGGRTWEILHVPGHSPGSVAFFDREEGLVFSGDVLFAGSIGRTDLWMGSLPVLMQSIFGKLVPLGDDVRVLSGHGPETTIGRESASNPFLHGGAPI